MIFLLKKIILVGRWSQDTGSDNEIHSHKTNSPNPLPNPDLTETSYLHHNKMNMPPSLLENIQENYNLRTSSMDNDRYKYGDIDRESLYGRKKDYQDNYGEYDTSYMQKPPSHYGSEKDYPSSQIVNQMRAYPGHESSYSIYDKQRGNYMGSKTDSPYMSKERIPTELYSPRDNHYILKSPPMYGESMNSVHSMLKNDYQVCMLFVNVK